MAWPRERVGALAKESAEAAFKGHDAYHPTKVVELIDAVQGDLAAKLEQVEGRFKFAGK